MSSWINCCRPYQACSQRLTRGAFGSNLGPSRCCASPPWPLSGSHDHLLMECMLEYYCSGNNSALYNLYYLGNFEDSSEVGRCPIPRSASNYLLGMTPIALPAFVGGTMIGMGAWSLVFASIGGAGRKVLRSGVGLDVLLSGTPKNDPPHFLIENVCTDVKYCFRF